MKMPSETIIFADSFVRNNTASETPYWSFNPNALESNDAAITLLHLDTAVVAKADGSAAALNSGELKNHGITAFNSEIFTQAEDSDI
jgi:hypothetical protein